MKTLALLVVILFSHFTFAAGFDAGGGGKFAIVLQSHDSISVNNGKYFLNVDRFRDVVGIDADGRSLTVDTRQIKLSTVSRFANATTSRVDSLSQLRRLTKEGEMTLLLIDFKNAKENNGRLVFNLTNDWGATLKVYQVCEDGAIKELDPQGALDLKSLTDIDSDFSIHVFLNPKISNRRN